MVRILFLVTLCVGFACSNDASPPGGGPGIDSGPASHADAQTDSDVDLGHSFADTGPAPVIDSGPGPMMDSGPGPVIDSGPQSDRDADPGDPSDGGMMTGRDTGFAMDAMTPADAGSVACTMNSDCAPSGWCRQTQAGGMACAAWQTEGGRCGGFTRPWEYERCLAGLRCMGRHPLLVDAPGTCVIEATAAQLEADSARYDGHVVGIEEAFLVMGVANCTRRGCPQTDLCCNSCTANLLIATSSSAMTGTEVRAPSGSIYACIGNECSDAAQVPPRILYSDHCDLPTGRYRFIGTYVAGPPVVFEALYAPGMYP